MTIKIGLFLAFAIFASASIAQNGSDNDDSLSMVSLKGYLRTTDMNIVQSITERSATQIARLPEREGEGQLFSAAVFITDGLDASGVEQFSQQYQVEVAGVEVKHVLDSTDQVLTLYIGAMALNFGPPGTLSDRLSRALGASRVQVAPMLHDADRADIAMSGLLQVPNLLIYRVEVVGSALALNNILDDSSVLAVIFDERSRILDTHQTHQASPLFRIQGAPLEQGRPLEAGPPPGITPDMVYMPPSMADPATMELLRSLTEEP